MSAFSKVGPLNWRTPIVDPKTGFPSPEFIRYFQQLFGNSDYIQGTKQNASRVLDGLALLDVTLGLVEQTGIDLFAKRALGVAAATSVPTRADADARYVQQKKTPAWFDPTGTFARTTFATYGGQTISNPPTQVEVQAIDDHVKILSQRLAALILDLRATVTAVLTP